MTKRIAVEKSLSNVSDALREKGYDVVELNSEAGQNENYSAVVVTGLDSNVMGMQDAQTSSPVIEASGLSADEVCKEIEERLQ
ncbi:uncharacterized protein UPF0180 [Cytobacillus horneckiae]|uniref:Uncharacterized protein n=1 Tax=Cytobacillus horneckiae TaxID=549687 RepID=A0A2N0ZFH2_9BACI|nr:YkuS family protein [Cytobacillus horneckiae]NRG44111.1 YkuS family protein [Bacillus sp. CRN 9]MBN6885199.1 YkuS family protein [Cytobacillus horneckiae]MCM3179056.1 YkuS family protein [Cytobacillus horneckiae]MEC1154273.1 YkuS family protein [Cytobacillus horneckiae]MED2937609.1 YkuS family protein [Cytobacillus horneckiae]